VHEDTKRRVLQACVDMAKQIYKGKNLKADFILDDTSRMMLDINGDDLANADLDLFVNSSSDDMKIRQSLEGLAQAFAQNGSSASTLLNVLKSESIAEMTHILEEDEEQRSAAAQKQEQAQLESQEKLQMLMLEDKQKDRDLEKYKVDKDYEIRLLEIQAKLNITPENDNSMEEAKLEETIRHNKAGEEEKVRANKEKETISRQTKSNNTK